MKKIEAIIRKTKFEEVKEALLSSDIDWFEYHDVHGIGQSRQERIYRGVQYSTDVIERVAITIVCRDQFLEPTVKLILRLSQRFVDHGDLRAQQRLPGAERTGGTGARLELRGFFVCVRLHCADRFFRVSPGK